MILHALWHLNAVLPVLFLVQAVSDFEAVLNSLHVAYLGDLSVAAPLATFLHKRKGLLGFDLHPR